MNVSHSFHNNNYFWNASGESQKCPKIFQDSRTYWHMETTARIVVITLSLLTNLLNMIVLYRWKTKGIYMIFHISLALSALLTSATGLLSPAAKILDPDFSREWPYYVAFIGVVTFSTISENCYAFISIDRWLSVVHPVFYNHVNTRRNVFFSIVFLWSIAAIPYGVIYVVERRYFRSTCIHGMWAISFAFKAPWYLVYLVLNMAVVTVMIGVCQIVICYLAVRTKLRLIRNRFQILRIQQISCIGVEKRRLEMEKQRLEQNRWMLVKSVFGASSVVITALIFRLPAVVVFSKPSVDPLHSSWTYLLLLARDIIPFFIYRAFYPQYRQTLRRMVSTVCSFC